MDVAPLYHQDLGPWVTHVRQSTAICAGFLMALPEREQLPPHFVCSYV